MVENNKRKVLIGGNWKCNGDSNFIKAFDSDLKSFVVENDKAEVMIFPPSIFLEKLQETYKHLIVGSQNISRYGNGAYTGELSPQLLKSIGISTTLIGHSERRQMFGDNEETIAAKIKNSEDNGIYSVICIGENLKEREENKTMDVIKGQLDTIIGAVKNWGNSALAYEPVWAIGTGKTASPEQAEEVHSEIRSYLAQKVSKEVAESVRIIYGGSVKDSNSVELIKKPNIDGFLVGGASIQPQFKTICDSYKQK